jgi:branched-chain amino acid transport system substrate-binding protein
VKKVVTMVSDYAPGADAEKFFSDRIKAGGGEILSAIRIPLANPDFSPFLQRAADAKPDALFIFVPSGQGGTFVRQFIERGLDKAGIKLIGPGDVTDDDLLPNMGDAVIGAVTAHMYSASHNSKMNKDYVAAFEKAYNFRPNFMSVGGYDGMHLIYEALKKTNGDTDGDKLMAAMKGMKWESPRGPISIDPDTRDIVQNIYIRKVEKVDGKLYNQEFATFEAVKDPGKTAK